MRTRYIQQANGKLVEVSENEAPAKLQIVPDIGPYQSMMTGEVIDSRRKHREHVKRHNLIEYGSEPLKEKAVKLVDPRRKQVIAEAVNHYGEEKIRDSARQLGEFLKWNTRK